MQLERSTTTKGIGFVLALAVALGGAAAAGEAGFTIDSAVQVVSARGVRALGEVMLASGRIVPDGVPIPAGERIVSGAIYNDERETAYLLRVADGRFVPLETGAAAIVAPEAKAHAKRCTCKCGEKYVEVVPEAPESCRDNEGEECIEDGTKQKSTYSDCKMRGIETNTVRDLLPMLDPEY